MPEPAKLNFTDTSHLGETLEAKHGLSRVGWGSLDLNRRGTRLSKAAMALRGIGHPHVGFRWNSGDGGTDLWYPQGISGLRNSTGSKKYLVVSWYGKSSNEKKGVRLSFVDVTDMDEVRYRHVLLVQPSKGPRVFRPIEFHAGGIATRKNHLYVADTSYGVRVFNAARMYRARADASKTRYGIIGGSAYAFNYRYILPQVGRYRLRGPPRFSYASMDWSRPGHPELLLGNYHNPPKYDNPPAAASWWGMSGTSISEGLRQVLTLPRRVQGAAARQEVLWLSCSGSKAKLRVGSYPFRIFRSYSWPHGCEDLHLSPHSGNLWCHTEYPDRRMVFAVKSAAYLG